MMIKTTLVALTLLMTLTACSDPKKVDKRSEVPSITPVGQADPANPGDSPGQDESSDVTDGEQSTDRTGNVNPEGSQGEKDPAEPSAPITADILGTWTLCRENEENSVRSTITFNDDSTFSLVSRGYKDNACTTTFSEAEIVAIRDQTFKLLKAFGETEETAAALADQLADFYRGVTMPGTFKIGATLANEAHELDLIYKDASTVYTSYKIEGNVLQIANSCDQDQIDEGTCSVLTGYSAESRTVDFGTSFTRQ